jgi:SH3-like domain-containing protein
MNKMKKFLLVLTVCIASMIAVTAQSPGSTMYVGVKKADVKTSTGFFASVRGTLELGAPVTVVRLRDKWTEIRSANPALSGWVASAALTGRKVSVSGYTPGAGEVAMAGKGFSGEVEQIYREGEKLDYSPVDAMESLTVPEEELYTFLAEGRLITGE